MLIPSLPHSRRASTCWTRPDAGLSMAERHGVLLFPGLMGTLCQLGHKSQQRGGCSNLFCCWRILVGIHYLWKLSDAELYHSSSQPKYLVIICIRVAPGKPRATLCLALRKHASANTLPGRDKKEMAWDWLPGGCGDEQKRLPPARSRLLRGKSLLSTRGNSQ